MKKRQAKDNYGTEMDEDAAMLEDVVSPSRYDDVIEVVITSSILLIVPT